MGQSDGEPGSGSNLALIVAVAVSAPAVATLVGLVIGLILAVAFIRVRRMRKGG